jgi:hypothetical protein
LLWQLLTGEGDVDLDRQCRHHLLRQSDTMA